jgi:membrane-associated phospholipid phosphatase
LIEWLQSWILSFLPWGIEVILWAQSWSTPFVDRLFHFAAFLGDEEFFLLLLPLVYWGFSKKMGRWLAYGVLLSTYLNSFVKHIIMIPRPDDPRIQVMRPVDPPNPSFPSGHAQTGVALWGFLAGRPGPTLARALPIVVTLVVGLSRIYLGVHTPLDVVGGWILGVAYLCLFLWLMPRVERWLGRQRLLAKLALAILLPLAGLFLHGADLRGLYPAPDATTIAGTLLGITVGFLLEPRWIGFREEGSCWQRLARLGLGLTVVALFWQGPKLLLPEAVAHGAAMTLRFMRYALSGLAAILLAPWLFVKLRLAESSRVQRRDRGVALSAGC